MWRRYKAVFDIEIIYTVLLVKYMTETEQILLSNLFMNLVVVESTQNIQLLSFAINH